MKKIALCVKQNVPGFRGEAHLFSVEPPMEYIPEYNEPPKLTEYVIVSGVNAFGSGPETFIFPADKDGNILSWGELDGSFQGDIDIVRALSNAGYTVKGFLQ